jgi:hypothetical protein
MSEDSPADKIDFESGRAIFYIPDRRSRPYDLGWSLPLKAVLLKELEFGAQRTLPKGTQVDIVQAEIVDGKDVILGFLRDGEPGICALEEVEVKLPGKG